MRGVFITAALMSSSASGFMPPPSGVRSNSLLRPSTATKLRATSNPDWALLFDCDGVIVETEELHRLAYNGAFEAFGLEIDGQPVDWSVEYYDILQNTVGGGKPKMNWYFTNTAKAWPEVTKDARSMPATDAEKAQLVDDLQDKKTEIYKKIVSEAAEARPGVLSLMDAAIEADDIAVGICSAATRAGFEKVVDAIVGKERLAKLDLIIAGDDVTAKKPDPMIYNLAREKLGLEADRCVVIEDSLVGLRAAKGASMRCIITYTASTAGEDFYGEGADAKVPDLTANGAVTLGSIFDPLKEGATTIIDGIRDAPTASSASASAVAAVAAGVDDSDGKGALRTLLLSSKWAPAR